MSQVREPPRIAFELTQTGLDVTGPVQLSQNGLIDGPGALNGRLSSASATPTAQLTVTYEYGEQCHGIFSGAFMVSGREMQGPYTGQNCVRAFIGVLRAAKIE